MEKMDARKRYTQMVLKQSFLKLLKEKPVNRITVKEVCALAQLNRATFYAHYSDCFALMESIENELIDAFEKSLRYVNSFDVTALIEAIRRTVRLYEQPRVWSQIQRRGMKSDVSWNASAQVYADLYHSLLGRAVSDDN